MANTLYHKLPDNSWVNISCPGGPSVWKVQYSMEDGNYYAVFSYNGANYIQYPSSFATVAAAQQALDNVISQINGGTFGP